MKTNKFRQWNGFAMVYNPPVSVTSTTGIDEVFDSSFMQFTGLVDKSGKEIYEGDICKTRDEGELLVCDDFNKFIYMVMFSEDHSGLNGYTQQDLEVIGNIYQHKHLLDND